MSIQKGISLALFPIIPTKELMPSIYQILESFRMENPLSFIEVDLCSIFSQDFLFGVHFAFHTIVSFCRSM
jgi:hypothetical protein